MQKKHIILFKKQTCRKPTFLGWLIIVAILLVAIPFLFQNIYRFLTVNDPVKSKTMVIEGWIPDYSIKKAIKLFRDDHYENMIVTGIPILQWQPISNYHNVAEATAAVIKKMGFRDTIYLAPIPSSILRDRTYSTAVVTRELFDAHPQWDKSFNIYSVGVHSRRSRLMFEKAFGDDYNIGIYADSDLSFDPVHWWRNSRGFRNVSNEFMAYLFVRLFFHPDLNTYEKKIELGKYIDSIETFRAKAIAEFANPDETPLDSIHFNTAYHDPYFYPVNPKYKIKAKFKIDTTGAVFGMATNTARKPNYRVYGHLYFTVSDTAQQLTVYQNVDYMNDPEYGKLLFLPFRDKTCGKTSYGAGRYLDIKIPRSDSVYLDFNKAYNPYCAYADRWSCPLVPFENHLEVHIFAGEKKYRDTH